LVQYSNAPIIVNIFLKNILKAILKLGVPFTLSNSVSSSVKGT